jgi:hypothetical protein
MIIDCHNTNFLSESDGKEMPANESPKKSMDTPGIDYSLVMNT